MSDLFLFRLKSFVKFYTMCTIKNCSTVPDIAGGPF